MIRNIYDQARQIMSIQVDNPELLRAQLAALSRMIPLLYFILVVDAWALATAFYGKAPPWLSVYVPALLSTVCIVRLAMWWRRRHITLCIEQTARELRRTNVVAAILGVSFASWGIALFPHGDAYAQSHLATFLTVAMLGSMLCLIHLRSAAIIVAATVCPPYVVFFILTDVTSFIGIAIDISLVTIGVIVVVLVQNRDFARMVGALKQTETLSNENRRLADLDSLTGLPNRRAFFAHLEKAFAVARSRHTRLAVGIIDLDGFKPVNDLYGHATGDRLLIEVANRLSSLDDSGALFTSRLGGDEFAYVMMNAGDDRTLIAQGEDIATALRTPITLPEAVIQISGSVGVAVYPGMAATPAQLYEHSDYALYHGKHAKRGSAILFSADHETRLNQDARIEQALKSADFETEMAVVFQPMVNIRSQVVIGFEALARWTSPTLGSVSPGEFIPVAERAGIIGTLTRPLLRKALAAAALWPPDMRLSFNLSAYDLSSAEGALIIVSIIEGSKFDAGRLDLEITETAFGHDFEQVQRSIAILRLLGCGISLDDFGTGYSSLSRLHALPLTKIKIDRSFVMGLDKSATGFKIVKSLLALSRDMGIDCVIEGVETQEEMSALRQIGGVMVQGYFYSPPIPEEQVLSYLNIMKQGYDDDRLEHGPRHAGYAG